MIKTVQLRIKDTEELLKDTSLNLKVIVLVRDPRGVMKSRSKMSWCDQPICNKTSWVCSDLNSDVENTWKLSKKYPNQIILIRYEDLCIQPYKTAEKLFKFLGLPQKPQFIDTYLEEHTGQLR